MSAATAQAQAKPLPKVLRIGLFRDGKPVAERLIRHGETVTVGDSPKCSFVIEQAQFGARFELFVPAKDAYVLQCPDWLDAKVQWKDGIKSAEELAARQEATRKGDVYLVPLNENVRGKLAVGSTTILFQFVPAPPEPVRSINPADFRARFFDDEDPLFLGLLGVFTVIASAFMGWVWLSPAPEHLDADNVLAAANLVVDRKIEQIEIVTPDKGETKKPDETKPAEKETKKPDAPAAKQTQTQAPTQDSVAKKSLLLQMLGSNGDVNNDQAANDILGDNSASMAKLDSALAGVSGVAQANGQNTGVKAGTSGGRSDAAVGLGVATGGTASTGGGVAVAIKKPKVGYEKESSDVEDGDGASIPSIVRKNNGRVQSCVETALKTNPNMSGRVVVQFAIVKGKVSEASVGTNTTNDNELGSCIARSVRSLRFDETVTARVEFPFVVSGQ